MAGVNIILIPSVYVPLSELKDGETFTFRYGDREHRFTDHIYMCVDENYVGERIVVDLTVFDSFYIGDSESIDVRRVKCKFIVEDNAKEIVEKFSNARLYDDKTPTACREFIYNNGYPTVVLGDPI
jgi:hypothetical protein